MHSRKPWLKPLGAAVIIALFVVGAIVLFGGQGKTEKAKNPLPQQTAATGASQDPTEPADKPTASRACPKPTVLPGDDDATRFKNRVFDYEEALLIPNALKALQALQDRGEPKGLVTDEMLEALRQEAAQAPDTNADMTVVLDRRQSEYDLDEESDNESRTAYVRAVYTTCRDGKVVNDPIVDTDSDANMSTWIQDKGAWRVIE